MENKIIIHEKEFFKMKTIQYSGKTYVEYRNIKERKSKFFEWQDEMLLEIENKEILKKILEENYNVGSDMID